MLCGKCEKSNTAFVDSSGSIRRCYDIAGPVEILREVPEYLSTVHHLVRQQVRFEVVVNGALTFPA